jgi:hypothetical protein
MKRQASRAATKKSTRRTPARRRHARRPVDAPASGAAVTHEDVRRTYQAALLLWRGTLALLAADAPTAHELLMAKLRRHGLDATSLQIVANPAPDGRMMTTLQDLRRPEPLPDFPRPPSDATLAKLRAFAQDTKPVRLGRPVDTDPLSLAVLDDWVRRHLPPEPRTRRERDAAARAPRADRARDYLAENVIRTTRRGKTLKYSSEALPKLIKRGRRMIPRNGNFAPLDAFGLRPPLS